MTHPFFGSEASIAAGRKMFRSNLASAVHFLGGEFLGMLAAMSDWNQL
jgi:hypothetical protein